MQGHVISTRMLAIRAHALRCLCMLDANAHCQSLWRGHDLAVVDGHGTVVQHLAWQGTLIPQWRGNFGRNDALCFLPSGLSNGQKGRFVLGTPKQI
jgi:hypothetical protein